MNRIFSTIIALLSPFIIFSQTQKTIEAVRIDYKIKIDGVLDELVWRSAPSANKFIQYNPFNGKEPSEQTEVKFLYDDKALYIGAFLKDSKVDKISRALGQRDDFNLADYFGVYIDPYNDANKSYGFFVTAAGTQVDLKTTTYNDYRWNAVWESSVKITEEGWYAELCIPYSALRFTQNNMNDWGLNIQRVIQRHRETSTWNFIDINIDGWNKQAGVLSGIKDIEPPIRLAFLPYISGYYQDNEGVSSYSFKGGMDVKYGINGSFTLDMMLIPDFGQVKSDEEVLNLSPFETYYGENREFFKEGMDLFNRAGIFYSRRIGGTPDKYYDAFDVEDTTSEELIENPNTAQLYNATKISGKTHKGLNIGVLNAVSKETRAVFKDTVTGVERSMQTQPLTNFNISVVEQSFNNSSYISLINTNVYRPETGYTANVTGTQGRYEVYKSIAISGAGALSQNQDLDNPVGYKYWMSVSKISGRFRFELFHNTEDPYFNPNDLGYLQSPDEQNQRATISYSIRKPFWVLLNWHNTINWYYNTMFDLNKFVNTRFSFNSSTTTKNHLSMGIGSEVKPVSGYDYHEPRIDGWKLETPSWQNISGWISSDYRKMVAIDLNGGTWKENDYNKSGNWFTFSPRLRLGNNFQMIYRHSRDNSYNSFGYVDDNGTDTVYIGRRNYRKQVNRLQFNYIFTPKSSLSFYLNHNWTRVDYKSYYTLNKDGTLAPNEDYEREDINFNAFNIDLAYTWQFAPGSEMSLVWKNEIVNESDQLVQDYGKNVENTFDTLGQNSISIKVLYYLDYLKLRSAIL